MEKIIVDSWENNHYEYSTFSWVIFNPETKTFKPEVYGSWGMHGTPANHDFKHTKDPAIHALYNEWRANNRNIWKRKRRALELMELKHWINRAVKLGNLPNRSLVKPLLAMAYQDSYKLIRLLATKSKSGFIQSLQKQVLNWLNETDKKYAMPLSPKQAQYLAADEGHESMLKGLFYQEKREFCGNYY